MNERHRVVAYVGALLLLCLSAIPGVAQVSDPATSSVSIEVTDPMLDGTFTVGFLNAEFSSTTYSKSDINKSYGHISMYVQNLRSSEGPWEVQLVIGDFIGTRTGTKLPSQLLTDRTVTIIADIENFPGTYPFNSASQRFDTNRLSWNSDGGQLGRYVATLSAMYEVPNHTVPDVYTSQLMLTVVSAP